MSELHPSRETRKLGTVILPERIVTGERGVGRGGGRWPTQAGFGYEWGCSHTSQLGPASKLEAISWMPRGRTHKLPQGLKPASLLALDGTTERRALPETTYAALRFSLGCDAR
jgi:hypothetical protein